MVWAVAILAEQHRKPARQVLALMLVESCHTELRIDKRMHGIYHPS